MKLTEGLVKGDLADLVMPIISIDEFNSKLDEDAIVIGFYVVDKDPANDLNRFIQKSPVDLLDTEVSPAPDPNGYYMVFVEVVRSADFKKKLFSIIEEVSKLVDHDLEDWRFTVYGHKGAFDLTEKNIEVLVRIEDIETLKAKYGLEEEAGSVLQKSVADTIELVEGQLNLCKGNRSITHALVDAGPSYTVLERNGLLEAAERLDIDAMRMVREMKQFLGEALDVSVFGDHMLVVEADGDGSVLLRIK